MGDFLYSNTPTGGVERSIGSIHTEFARGRRVALQGMADTITTSEVLGCQVWWHGQCSVQISTRDTGMKCWSNGGRNLRVE